MQVQNFLTGPDQTKFLIWLSCDETGNSSCRWSGSRGLSWKRFPSLVALASQACFAWRPQGLLLWSLLRSSSSYSSWQAAIWCLWQSQQRGNQTSGQWSTPHSNGYLAAKQKERRPRIKKQDNSLSYYYTSSSTKTVFLFDTWWCHHTYWYPVWYVFTFLGGKKNFFKNKISGL